MKQTERTTEADTKGTILLVDDEDAILHFISDALEDEGFQVETAFDGTQALEVARACRPDLVILDIMMPKLDGFAVCQALRAEMDIPILFLSARQGESDKIAGFGAGADDYIMKPFSIKELMARVEAHLRRQRRDQQRAGQRREHMTLTYGRLVVDLSAYEARYDNVALPLTRKEFEVLQLLVLHPRQVFSREVIYNRIWGMDSLGSTETVTEHVKRLRKKLEQVNPHTQYIGTVWGVGYKWEHNTFS